MTDYSRGYAAGLKAAAEVCLNVGYEWTADTIKNLPVQGEAEGSGPCVVVPVDQLEWLARQIPSNSSGKDAYIASEAVSLAKRALAAAKEK